MADAGPPPGLWPNARSREVTVSVGSDYAVPRSERREFLEFTFYVVWEEMARRQFVIRA